MKNASQLHEWQERVRHLTTPAAAKAEKSIPEQPCFICQKMLKGAYGQTTLGERVVWSCSVSCEKEVQRQRKEYYASLFPRQTLGAKGDAP